MTEAANAATTNPRSHTVPLDLDTMLEVGVIDGRLSGSSGSSSSGSENVLMGDKISVGTLVPVFEVRGEVGAEVSIMLLATDGTTQLTLPGASTILTANAAGTNVNANNLVTARIVPTSYSETPQMQFANDGERATFVVRSVDALGNTTEQRVEVGLDITQPQVTSAAFDFTRRGDVRRLETGDTLILSWNEPIAHAMLTLEDFVLVEGSWGQQAMLLQPAANEETAPGFASMISIQLGNDFKIPEVLVVNVRVVDQLDQARNASTTQSVSLSSAVIEVKATQHNVKLAEKAIEVTFSEPLLAGSLVQDALAVHTPAGVTRSMSAAFVAGRTDVVRYVFESLPIVADGTVALNGGAVMALSDGYSSKAETGLLYDTLAVIGEIQRTIINEAGVATAVASDAPLMVFPVFMFNVEGQSLINIAYYGSDQNPSAESLTSVWVQKVDAQDRSLQMVTWSSGTFDPLRALDATHHFRVSLEDSLRNVAQQNFTIIVDRMAPGVTEVASRQSGDIALYDSGDVITLALSEPIDVARVRETNVTVSSGATQVQARAGVDFAWVYLNNENVWVDIPNDLSGVWRSQIGLRLISKAFENAMALGLQSDALQDQAGNASSFSNNLLAIPGFGPSYLGVTITSLPNNELEFVIRFSEELSKSVSLEMLSLKFNNVLVVPLNVEVRINDLAFTLAQASLPRADSVRFELASAAVSNAISGLPSPKIDRSIDTVTQIGTIMVIAAAQKLDPQEGYAHEIYPELDIQAEAMAMLQIFVEGSGVTAEDVVPNSQGSSALSTLGLVLGNNPAIPTASGYPDREDPYRFVVVTRDTSDNEARKSFSFIVDTVSPMLDASNPIKVLGTEKNPNAKYVAGNTLVLEFSEQVRLQPLLSEFQRTMFGLADGALGVAPSFVIQKDINNQDLVNGKTVEIVLGDNPTITPAQMITFTFGANVVADPAGNVLSGVSTIHNLTLPNIGPTAKAGAKIPTVLFASFKAQLGSLAFASPDRYFDMVGVSNIDVLDANGMLGTNADGFVSGGATGIALELNNALLYNNEGVKNLQVRVKQDNQEALLPLSVRLLDWQPVLSTSIENPNNLLLGFQYNLRSVGNETLSKKFGAALGALTIGTSTLTNQALLMVNPIDTFELTPTIFPKGDGSTLVEAMYVLMEEAQASDSGVLTINGQDGSGINALVATSELSFYLARFSDANNVISDATLAEMASNQSKITLIYADNGNDLLRSIAGAVWFFGGAGDDIIETMIGGGIVENYYNGGEGRDVFVLELPDTALLSANNVGQAVARYVNVITDFNVVEDKLFISRGEMNLTWESHTWNTEQPKVVLGQERIHWLMSPALAGVSRDSVASIATFLDQALDARTLTGGAVVALDLQSSLVLYYVRGTSSNGQVEPITTINPANINFLTRIELGSQAFPQTALTSSVYQNIKEVNNFFVLKDAPLRLSVSDYVYFSASGEIKFKRLNPISNDYEDVAEVSRAVSGENILTGTLTTSGTYRLETVFADGQVQTSNSFGVTVTDSAITKVMADLDATMSNVLNYTANIPAVASLGGLTAVVRERGEVVEVDLGLAISSDVISWNLLTSWVQQHREVDVHLRAQTTRNTPINNWDQVVHLRNYEGQAEGTNLDSSTLLGALVYRGSNGADTVRGTIYGDDIQGGEGDDRLSGNHGDDIIVDLSGRSEIDGGNNNDSIRFAEGQALGGEGNDTVRREQLGGSTAIAELIGGVGNDILLGSAGNEIFYAQDKPLARVVLGSATVGVMDVITTGDGVDEVNLSLTGAEVNLGNGAKRVILASGSGAAYGTNVGEIRINNFDLNTHMIEIFTTTQSSIVSVVEDQTASPPPPDVTRSPVIITPNVLFVVYGSTLPTDDFNKEDAVARYLSSLFTTSSNAQEVVFVVTNVKKDVATANARATVYTFSETTDESAINASELHVVAHVDLLGVSELPSNEIESKLSSAFGWLTS